MINKFIRKYLMNGYVSIPLMLCMILSTWSSIASNKRMAYHISGEEMFRGIFFVEGKYAELIPELKATEASYFTKQLSVEENKALILAKNQIITSIKAENSNYFDDFKATLQTASPMVVKDKILQAHALLEKKAMELSKMNSVEIEKKVQKVENLLSKQQGKEMDKKMIKSFLEQFNKDGSNPQSNNGKGTCFFIVVAAAASFVFWFAIAIGRGEQTSIKNAHSLLLEQLAGSICNAAPQIV